jgi:hypothetical protein
MLVLSTLVFEVIHIGFQGVVVDDLVNASRSHARLQRLGSSGTQQDKTGLNKGIGVAAYLVLQTAARYHKTRN